MTVRADRDAVRVIYHALGLEAAASWQSVPLIDMRPVGWPARDAPHTVPASGLRFPWADAVYLSDPVQKNGVLVATRISPPIDGAPADAVAVCRGVLTHGVTDRKTLLVTYSLSNTEHAELSLNHALGWTKRDGAQELWHAGMDLPKPLLGWVLLSAQKSIWDLGYLSQCPEYLVEVKPNGATPSRKSRKTAKTKPWLREDLPTVILIDPSKAREYGHRVDRGGTHASPIPHQRRGHWRRLDDDRRVWVRPSWVGDPEWRYQGSRYRVVQT